MSMSRVVSGTPWSTPAAIPTMMNWTWLLASACSVSANRARFIQFSNCEYGLEEILDARQSLLGRKLKHLANLRAIDAIVVGCRAAVFQRGFRRHSGYHTP